jgi:CheY-like chemotaxis protein/drug/metabolite transporter (DMT)-like permease
MDDGTIHAAGTETLPARVLVVDDDAINRKKLRIAVANLGHDAETAVDGREALEMLAGGKFDAVLLDIVMPEMDGFDVLDRMRATPSMRDVPVIVVSALDDETESVVRAIELGAEDFLPKSFDLVILKARLEASLSRKRFRDQEKEYFGRIERLTEAAEKLERGRFDPDSLALDDLVRHSDPLGRLAAVFRGMANEIYERELKLHRAVATLQGGFLVLAVGLVWGLTPALSRMAAGLGSNPLGLAVWVNGIAALICLGIASYRRRLPRLSWNELRFFVYWAIIAGILQRMTTFIAAAHVEAAMLSLIVTLQGFIVFAIAAMTGMERANAKRLVGLLVGLGGVSLVLFTRFDIAAGAQNAWLFFAMLLPLLFALEALVLAGRRPVHVDIFASVGLMMGLSAAFLAPVAWATGSLLPLGPEIGRLEMLVLLMGLVGAASLLLAFRLVATAGAVFYSQSAYAMTIAGVVWGMLLLSEELAPLAWLAFAIIVLGMYLVEPKRNDEELVIKRSFAQ